MTEIVYYVASSLDGFLAPRDGSLGWLTPFESSGTDYGYADFYASVDAVLVGARTYEQALTFPEWPYTGKPTWVFSSRTLAPAAPDVVVTDATPDEVVADLARRGIARAWLVGGGALAGSFQSAGLIDEYRVSVMPVVLGSGIGILGGRGLQQTLELAGLVTCGDGVVQGTYRGAATTGDVQPTLEEKR